jgi:hypothetical protein
MSTLKYPSLQLDYLTPSSSPGVPVEHTIRLLTIHPSVTFSALIVCSLSVSRLGVGRYEALSYTWGPKLPVSPIFVDGYVLEVEASLIAALRRFRQKVFPRVI